MGTTHQPDILTSMLGYGGMVLALADAAGIVGLSGASRLLWHRP
ncbi:MAG TPA: hypothetical protein VGR22_09715 [Thermomicrobiales bacterium]|nr:hypothetical protein [Thermomicrobiales bacterium]